MALCVVVHGAGIAAALRWLRRQRPALAVSSSTGLFVRLAGWMVAVHLVEITVWGVYYAAQGAMPDLAAALYFSAVTYTTTGYGDLVLPARWRLVGAVEALTGILMCGWSTGFFVAVFSQVLDATPPLPQDARVIRSAVRSGRQE
jgi:hypothetical protein